MVKQQWLAFLEPECLEALWEQLPAAARDEVTAQYARLMARASVAQIRAAFGKDNTVQENDDESNNG